MTERAEAKFPLPSFLKMLTNNNIAPSKAMAVAGKIYKTFNTADKLASLSEFSLESAGVDKDIRKSVLAAVRKAGYQEKPRPYISRSANAAPSSSKPVAKQEAKPKTQRKRKRDDDVNDLLPDRPPEEGDTYGSLDFNEILDEEAIRSKYTVINRAPIMMAWAFVVAERLGFQREEALSIASVYTEMNAITKGVSLGLYASAKQKGMEANRTGSQPYVELMGRRPLYQTADGHWRALAPGTGAPAPPAAAFAYISRALRQTAPPVLGALRLLAASFAAPAELNARGFALYRDFRPPADGWGARGELRCDAVLALRSAHASAGGGVGAPDPAGRSALHPQAGAPRSASDPPAAAAAPDDLLGGLVRIGSADAEGGQGRLEPAVGEDPSVSASGAGPGRRPSPSGEGERAAKQARRGTTTPPERDEFDAALDDDDGFFDGFDLSAVP